MTVTTIGRGTTPSMARTPVRDRYRVASWAAMTMALFVAGLPLSTLVQAAPATYNRVYFESSIAVSPTAHTEREVTSRTLVSLDVAAQQIEFGASTGLQATRALDLLDASSDGASLLSQIIGEDNGCEGMPPCPVAVSISNGYMTLPGGSALNRPKGLLSASAELFFSVQGEEGRAQGESSYTGVEATLSKPSTLTVAELLGDYRLVLFNNELERDVVGNSIEEVSVNQLALTFNGDGTCSGNLFDGTELQQESLWPSIESRTNVLAGREDGQTFLACDYAVDAVAGTVTVTVMVSDGGDTFDVSLTLFVSAQARYLSGHVVEENDEEISLSVDQALVIGARTGTSSTTNGDMAGVYFMSTIGESLTGTETAGVDTDFVSRAALEFSGATPDAEGFSDCTILGSSFIGPARSLGGSVPGPATANVEFVGIHSPTSASCRYRVDDSTSVTVELGTLLGVAQTQLSLSDDGETLLGTRLLTTEDPLPVGFDTFLAVPGVGFAELLVLQRYSGSATDVEVADFAAPIVPAIDPSVVVVASVLPGGRAVQVGDTATAFATLINGGASETGIGCDIRYRGSRSLDFFYQQTDPATNAPLGERNTPIDVPAGIPQAFFFGITPFEEFAPEDIELEFSCLNATPAAPLVGLNTLLLSASTTPVADIIALGATVTNNGIAQLDENRNGFFSLASFNVGASEAMEVSVDTGDSILPLLATICQTNSTTGACENPAAPSSGPVTVTIPASGTPTFAVFLSASESIALDPANKRVFVRFRDTSGEVRGATSVAIQAP